MALNYKARDIFICEHSVKTCVPKSPEHLCSHLEHRWFVAWTVSLRIHLPLQLQSLLWLEPMHCLAFVHSV